VSNALRVLVVEDEALICSFIEDALSDGGFEACSVHSGEAAMSTFRDGRKQCRALLTDVNLGDGISGWELARMRLYPGGVRKAVLRRRRSSRMLPELLM